MLWQIKRIRQSMVPARPSFASRQNPLTALLRFGDSLVARPACKSRGPTGQDAGERTDGTARDGAGYNLKHQSPTEWEAVMARCETCGNDYDKAFQVSMNGATHTFDSFECAIHALAPTCDNCGIRIVGHGLEKEGTFYCCDHCAEVKGVIGLRDRIGAGGVIEMGPRA
jgi:hypothetical protein